MGSSYKCSSLQKDIQLLKELLTETLSTVNLLTDKNSTTISDIEQHISVLQENCQLSEQLSGDIPSTENNQHVPTDQISTADHNNQHSDDSDQKSDQTNHLNEETPANDTEALNEAFTDNNQPTQEKIQLKLKEYPVCSAAIDEAKQSIQETLR